MFVARLILRCALAALALLGAITGLVTFILTGSPWAFATGLMSVVSFTLIAHAP
jgi:nicotinamide riboside transporter PnuC